MEHGKLPWTCFNSILLTDVFAPRSAEERECCNNGLRCPGMRRPVVGAHGALCPSHPRHVTGAAAHCRGHDRCRGRHGSVAMPLMSRHQNSSNSKFLDSPTVLTFRFPLVHLTNVPLGLPSFRAHALPSINFEGKPYPGIASRGSFYIGFRGRASTYSSITARSSEERGCSFVGFIALAVIVHHLYRS